MTDNKTRTLLEKAADLLEEVRTGEDFECDCGEHAREIRRFLERESE